ncbi:MAG: sugar phosphate isomerase/epimerase [Planctomycetes bacterium]|nr:sugar phosphate isomerase/epimerase [Planctomycetota bacterium]
MATMPKLPRRLGVCSWSLQPHSVEELVRSVRACGVECIQLSLASLRTRSFDRERTSDALSDAGITIRSGMTAMRGEDYSSLESIRRTGGIRLDAHWRENLAIARADADNASALGLELVTFHAGFLPHDRTDPERPKLLERLQTIVDVFADRGLNVGFETGQESAATLLEFLSDLDRDTAGVNFDPANMILYGMGDPVVALEELGRLVAQVHVKDARAAKQPGAWGQEVIVGQGEVDWPQFFAVLDDVAPSVDLMIEREAGTQRIADVKQARDFVRSVTGAART